MITPSAATSRCHPTPRAEELAPGLRSWRLFSLYRDATRRHIEESTALQGFWYSGLDVSHMRQPPHSWRMAIFDRKDLSAQELDQEQPITFFQRYVARENMTS